MGGVHEIASGPRAANAGVRRRFIAVLLVLAAGIVVAITRSGDSTGTSTVDTSRWVNVTDRVVGFTDLLPSQPQDIPIPAGTLGTVGSLHLAVVGSQDGLGVASGNRRLIAFVDGEMTQALPESEFATNLRAAIYGFAASSGFDLQSQRAGTFDSYPANVGTLRGHGQGFKVVAFMVSSTRLFVIATTSQLYDSVTAAFHTIAASSGRSNTAALAMG